MHVVLDRGTSQEEPVPALETKQCLPPSTGRVLDVLRLVQNHVLPLHTLEVLLVLGNLEGRKSSQDCWFRLVTYQLVASD